MVPRIVDRDAFALDHISMRVFFLAVILCPSWLYAAVQVGTGLSSSMSGRPIPGLELGVGGEAWKATASAIGVQSSYYYHASYSASFFRTWKAGEFLWSEVQSGVGGGLMYSVRGFQDQGSTTEESKNDFALGPAFFVQWFLVGPVYLQLEMIWGLRGINELIGLNGQDVIFLSLGLSSW